VTSVFSRKPGRRHYERGDGPVWLAYAVVGLASSVFHASGSEVRTFERTMAGGPATQ
jgi:hypothetical protein